MAVESVHATAQWLVEHIEVEVDTFSRTIEEGVSCVISQLRDEYEGELGDQTDREGRRILTAQLTAIDAVVRRLETELGFGRRALHNNDD